MSSKRKQAQDTKNTVAVNVASALQLDKALGDVSSASILVQGLFGKISETLVTKHSELKAVTDTIELKTAELADLHGKDKILLSIDDLRVEFEEEKDQLDEALEAIKRDREQAEAEYQYDLLQRRKSENDQWAEVVRVRDRDHKIRLEEFDRRIKEREEELLAKQAEYKAAIDRAASFDEVLKKEVDKQVSIVSNVLKKDHTHQLEIINIQNKSLVDGLKTDNTRLLEIIKNNDSVIMALQKQLAAAQEAQTKLASEAVAGAANQKGMADMQSLITNIGGPNGARVKS